MIGIPHPYLTEGIPGVGGYLKQELEDFIVEEIPLYHPVDHGEHTFFEVEKRDLSTPEALERIAHALNLPLRDLGFAGLKDRKAVTRQVLSARLAGPERVLALEIPQIRILWARLHTNKLRTGHLRGNRFRIRLRDIEGDAATVDRIIAEVQRRGLPNFFGPQRFGNRGDAFRIGRALLLKDHEGAVRRLLGYPSSTEKNPHVIEARCRFMAGDLRGALEEFPRSYRQERQILEQLIRSGGNCRSAVRYFAEPVRKLYVSAYQSHLFNRILERRLAECGNDPSRIHAGDLAWIHRSGAVFKVLDAQREQPRADVFEISPSGPIFGIKMIQPEGLQGGIEASVLAQEGLVPKVFNQLMPGLHMEGGRRPLRVPIRELHQEILGKDLCLEFFLSKGSYATTFLREIMKSDEIPPGILEDGEVGTAPPVTPQAPGSPVEQVAAGLPAAEGPMQEELDLEAEDEPVSE